jgi:hypothetical protein
MRDAASRTFCAAGNSIAMSTPMMAITTSNSISVNPRRDRSVFMTRLESKQSDADIATEHP